MKLDNLLSIVLLLGAVMSEQKRRGLKRKPNGELVLRVVIFSVVSSRIGGPIFKREKV